MSVQHSLEQDLAILEPVSFPHAKQLVLEDLDLPILSATAVSRFKSLSI